MIFFEVFISVPVSVYVTVSGKRKATNFYHHKNHKHVFVSFVWICFWHLIIIAPPGASLSINKYIFAFAYVLSQYVGVCVRVSLCARVCVRLLFRFFVIFDVLFNKEPLEAGSKAFQLKENKKGIIKRRKQIK